MTPWKGKPYQPLTEGLEKLRIHCEENHIPIMRRDTESYIRGICKKHKAPKILEIGTCVGYSAMVFALIDPNAIIYSVERDPYAVEIAKFNINSNGLNDRINIIANDGLKAIDSLIKKGEGDFDIVFIDGAKSQYKQMTEKTLKIMKKGGIILSDDIWQRGITFMDDSNIARKHRTSVKNMKEYIDYLINNPRIETTFMDIGDGLAVSKYLGL